MSRPWPTTIPQRFVDARSPFAPEWVFEMAARRPASLALASPRSRVSYAHLALRVRRLARVLQQHDVGVDDHVVSLLPAAPGAVVAALATQLLGAVSVEIARSAGPDAHRTVFARTRPRVAFVHAHDVAALLPLIVAADVAHVFVFDDDVPAEGRGRLLEGRAAGFLTDDGRVESWSGRPQQEGTSHAARLRAHDETLHPPAMARDDVDAPALVLFTSGSTGQPTGVVLTHRNLGNARQIAAALDLQPSDRGMLVLPLSYSYGRSVVHSHLLCGASVHLDPRFLYPRLVVDAMAREQITTFAGVPLTYELLRRHIEPARLALPALRQVTQAGGAMKSETRAWVRQAFPQAAFFSMYGATEATARLTIVPAEKSVEKDGSIGIPIPGVHVRVVDDDGADVPRGATGHLVAAGDNISPGYLDDPERTAETFRGGWLWTGDLAREDDDGYLYVVGRAKEMMKIGGRRASPRTVEDVVIAHPDVADAVVCGVRDEMNGEVVAVALVEKEGRHVEHEALRRFCRQRLPAWLVPRFVQVLARLPRNENGKVQRANVAAGLQRVADDERQDEAGLRHHTTSSSTHVAPSGSFAGSGGRTMNLGTGPSGTARQPSSLSLAHAESPARITDTTKSSSRPTSGDRT